MHSRAIRERYSDASEKRLGSFSKDSNPQGLLGATRSRWHAEPKCSQLYRPPTEFRKGEPRSPYQWGRPPYACYAWAQERNTPEEEAKSGYCLRALSVCSMDDGNGSAQDQHELPAWAPFPAARYMTLLIPPEFGRPRL
jgi:hypothetical protein